ncbi:hypothetical protein [Nostoc sp. LPT]|uniref:hypothetical protein n=1 Tax=Nostoc sp. LPT TaxID=2815387 RepID=UPI001DF7DD99|nr:hypothetical protein [Nostoc sp. LPT]MBN4003220.1 hypothetical protein [Nostoc sp. LPT]
MSNKHLLKVKPIHPKEFKLKHGLSVSEIHELSDYPPETLKHWLADEYSSRYQQPKESVLNHFGLLDLYLSAS